MYGLISQGGRNGVALHIARPYRLALGGSQKTVSILYRLL
jgi:hypothetical protein